MAKTFDAERYEEVVLDEPVTVYRVWSEPGEGGRPGAKEFGTFWTPTKPVGKLQAGIDLALRPEWGNAATRYTAVVLPVGTRLFVGRAAYQGARAENTARRTSPEGAWVGGGIQIVLRNARKEWKNEAESGVLR